MSSIIEVAEQRVELTYKRIKNVYLSVKPPNGEVFVSAPVGMKSSAIQTFVLAKLPWIRKHQTKLREKEREPRREYVEMETHLVWGHRYLLSLNESSRKQSVICEGNRLILNVKPNSTRDQKAAIYEAWSRDELRSVAMPMIANWSSKIGVSPGDLFVQKMKTRWGSCNIANGNIRLNTELVKKPKELLEFVVVHELTHLLEKNHSKRFYSLMDKFMPSWKEKSRQLDALPIGR